MSKDKNHWFIVIAILIIIVLAIAFSSSSDESKGERTAELKRRKEEEEKLARELKELQAKQEILEKHELINEFTKEYLEKVCEKRYRQLIQVLLVLLLIVNGCIYFLVPKVGFMNLITWNGIVLGAVNLIAVFFFLSVKKAKKYLKEIAMNYIEYRVYANRDKEYFKQKMKFYKEEIEKIKNEIEIKSNRLGQVKIEQKNNLLN